MKALLFSVAFLASSTAAFAQSTDGLAEQAGDGTLTPHLQAPVEDHLQLDVSMQELQRQIRDYRPMPVYVFDGDGTMRVYNTQAEADAAETKRRDERQALEQRIAQQNQIYDAAAKERADRAGWKLIAFGAGIAIGLLRILWGVATGSKA